ncbi:MAG: pyridoxal-phosphate dependent enzyme, partial [Synergistota bacterium]|nr:pyridoxal-phosphate dependent enzyme [Synergistota bacterium]
NTIAGGICDGLWGYADDGTHTLNYIRRSEGYALAVSDEEIKAAQAYLAQKEGLFVEPSGAAGVAGLVKSASGGMIGADSCVIVILSGHGLKDMRVLGEFDIPVIDNDVRELIKIVED